jgi:hypothetical protein
MAQSRSQKLPLQKAAAVTRRALRRMAAAADSETINGGSKAVQRTMCFTEALGIRRQTISVHAYKVCTCVIKLISNPDKDFTIGLTFEAGKRDVKLLNVSNHEFRSQ